MNPNQSSIGTHYIASCLCPIALSLLLFFGCSKSTDKSKTGDGKPTVQTVEPVGPEKSFTNSIGMKFVLVPAGKFIMGSPESEAKKKEGEPNEAAWRRDHEGPQHEVIITNPFYMGTCEVTQREYEKGLGFTPSPNSKILDLPKIMIDWFHAVDYCKELSELPAEKQAGRKYRLPTEAEWEYACRAGSKTPYCFGDDAKQLDQYASIGELRPGGKRKPNAWGLFDMHGNVWEFCADAYDAKYYEISPKSDPQGPAAESKGQARVLRGGCYADEVRNYRSAVRHGSFPPNNWSSPHVGFRVICEVPVKGK